MPGVRLGRPGRVERLADEGGGRLLVGFGVRRPERLQRVPLGKARKEVGEDVGRLTRSSATGRPATWATAPSWPCTGRTARATGRCPAVMVVDVAHRVAGGVHAVALEALDPPRARPRPGRRAAWRRRRRGGWPHVAWCGASGVGGLRRGGEVLAVPPRVPAALLDAAHGQVRAAAGRDEHGGVEAAVLLGAEHLLALVDEQGEVGGFLELEVADAGALVELLDERAELDRAGERAVGELAGAAEDGKDGEGACDLRFAECEVLRDRGHAGQSRGAATT